MQSYKYLILFVILFFGCTEEPDSTQQTAETPEKENSQIVAVNPVDAYGALFKAVQMEQVFPDGKTFVDCTAKADPEVIMNAYQKESESPDFDLSAFVGEWFEKPKQYASGFESDTNRSPSEHINDLWPVLTREADSQDPLSSLIALPEPYIVPGGRFGEIYYWDSYFTMLGLEASGKTDMIGNMVENFAYLIDEVGFIPNGNRSYFITRSQPPFFSAMVRLLATSTSKDVLAEYLPQMEKEYAFWMDGLDQLPANQTGAVKHVVKLDDGAILNRYWDQGSSPRPEMYRDDVELAESSQRMEQDLYSNIRAACESGWDFSTRWFGDAENMSTIRTTLIIPVDLNALLYHMEQNIADAWELKGDQSKSAAYRERAEIRRQAVMRYCWDEAGGYFRDYDFEKKAFTPVPTLAGVYPLFFSMADETQAARVAEVIKRDFLMDGGVVTTLNNSGQQWDYPNGWAPLQWATIKGLRNYNQNELANEIKDRWQNLNVQVYNRTGKMVEKYNVTDLSLKAGGGEYPVQDGFGWTNGVLLRLMSEDSL
ncbi:MAG: alpha,alpha-trehalase TreF [Bacteroidetes bacterium]|nr:alpha,alpha-trehalase TreF [Bacteroidota bacterium]